MDLLEWRGRSAGLPWPALRGDYQLANAAAALAALECLRRKVPIDMGAIRRGLVEVELPGRFQVLPGRPVVILDVAHNPQAAERLGESLARMGTFATTYAVFGMLKDKDIAGVAADAGAVRRPVAACAAARSARCDCRRAAHAARRCRHLDPGGDVRQRHRRLSACARAGAGR